MQDEEQTLILPVNEADLKSFALQIRILFNESRRSSVVVGRTYDYSPDARH